MSLGRRSFVRSVAAGTAACVVGCEGASPEPTGDAAVPCPTTHDTAQPLELDFPSGSYFDQISADLDAAGLGTPTVFVDMDRVDANIDAIGSGIGSPDAWRVVVKSLPSLDLLSYVAERSGSRRLLVLHLPFCGELLRARPDALILMGKTHRASAVRHFFETLPVGTDLADVASRTTFLADGVERLLALSEVGAALGITLRVAVEIDVGLRRSGVSEPAELAPVLEAFSTTDLRFAGLLGYDGHVAYTPINTPAAVGEAWTEATAVFQSFVDVLNEPAFSALASLPDLVFHSGGSATYPMYGSGTPVNDVAAGGGVLRPGAYPNHVIGDLLPAIFIATPVLRVYDEARLPFFTEAQSRTVFEGRRGLTIYGGGWPAFYTHPFDVQPAPFVSDPTDVSMVPNQGMVTAPIETPIAPGDWIFYHPRQSDALFQFEEIRMVRGGRLDTDATMAAFPRRY